jgi:hypothetical protein
MNPISAEAAATAAPNTTNWFTELRALLKGRT